MDDEPVLLSLDDEEPASPEIMDDAGSLLARRSRSERDLADRLARRGYEEGEIEPALRSLKRLGLVDDASFGREWIASRKGARSLGRQAMLEMLGTKGLNREAAESALESSGYDEGRAAEEFARASLKRLSGLSPVKQAAKLNRMLASRGFEGETSQEAIRAILPPEGWD